ncbi:hypothetical protein ACGFYU_10580 [Streptomyces sp. NPDC048337]|uniref:hypothetical protein n=1 Tax=Streptomyces sp. NPDC048337 TaxID=3365535 RepID=UPI003724644C
MPALVAGLVVVHVLGPPTEWQHLAGDSIGAVSLLLPALPKNSERRAEHAVQRKRDASAAALLQQQEGKQSEAPHAVHSMGTAATAGPPAAAAYPARSVKSAAPCPRLSATAGTAPTSRPSASSTAGTATMGGRGDRRAARTSGPSPSPVVPASRGPERGRCPAPRKIRAAAPSRVAPVTAEVSR